MKYLLPVLALTLVACNTFNGAVDGSQQIVGTTVDSAQSMVSDTAKGIGAGSATFVEGIATDIRKASE
jgi:predicted small secreted protein|tara:strand:+ start:1498 stop:1701 length:204 start_codon:yes stop_codon:yes gene_type:complete